MHNFASKPLHLSGKSHVEMIKFHPVFTRDEIQADPGNAHACLPQWGAVKISDFYWVELRGKIPLQKLIFLTVYTTYFNQTYDSILSYSSASRKAWLSFRFPFFNCTLPGRAINVLLQDTVCIRRSTRPGARDGAI